MTDDIKKSVRCCREIFDAFADEYEKAVMQGRQKTWADAVRATVAMLEDVSIPIQTGEK